MNIKLGLPLTYKKQPQFFDIENIGSDADSKNSVIEKILQQYQAKRVLDLTCGTGSQVLFLAKRGFEMTGADFSPDLLKLAKIKAKREGLKVKFIDGDMRNLRLGEFDAVITIANAIGHLTKTSFAKAIRNIGKNLKMGGIYIFDIFNLEAMTKAAVANLACCRRGKVGDTQMLNTQLSTLDKKSGILTSFDSYMTQKHADRPHSFNHKFALQLYSVGQLSEILSQNGFKVLEQREIDGSSFVATQSTTILTIAQKE